MDTAGFPGEGGKPAHFAEPTVVSFRRPVMYDDLAIPAGTKATVVVAYCDGIGYEVEIFAPFHAVVTVEADDLTA